MRQAHHRCTRKQCRKHAETGYKSRDQDGLVTMALEIILHMLEPLRRQEHEASEPEKDPAAIMMSDRKANIIASSSAARGDKHHERQVKIAG